MTSLSGEIVYLSKKKIIKKNPELFSSVLLVLCYDVYTTSCQKLFPKFKHLPTRLSGNHVSVQEDLMKESICRLNPPIGLTEK